MQKKSFNQNIRCTFWAIAISAPAIFNTGNCHLDSLYPSMVFYTFLITRINYSAKIYKYRQTIISEVIVQELEQWEAIPGVWGLHLQRRIHVHREQWPEYLRMLHQ